MIRNTSSVLSTIQASAADISQSSGFLSITGCPSMKYSLIQGVGKGFIARALEYTGSITVTPTAANSSTYTLVISQFNAALGRVVTAQATYTTAASGDTATTICNAWRAQLALIADLEITVSGSATLIIAANANKRSAIISVTGLQSNIAVAQTTGVSATIVSSTNATPIVVTTAANTWVVGQLVTISGHLVNTNANGTFLITATNGTTTITLGDQFTGEDVAGNGVGAGTGTVNHGSFATPTSTTSITVGNQSRGSYLDLVAAGVPAASILSTKTYSQIQFDYAVLSRNSVAGANSQEENTHTMYVQDDATNFAAFRTRLIEVTKNYAASTTNADPANLEIVD